jgi:transposase InsO family protein
VWQANRCVYSARKLWRQLRREGVTVARCTVERLMRDSGFQGVVRGGKRVCTTISADLSCERTLELVKRSFKRSFKAPRPNELWVADFTHVATWRGVVYATFVIDVFSRLIVGWRASSAMRTDLVLDAPEQATYEREADGRADD